MEANQPIPKTIDEYIAGFPKETQVILQKVRKTIREAAPEAKEAIKYAMPTFVLEGNLVHFAAFQHHVGLYPAPAGIDKFKEALSIYKTGKGSVQFPLDHPIPYCLIREITVFRVGENLEKAKKRKKPAR